MNRTTIVGLVGAAILIMAIGLNFWLNRDVSQTVATANTENEIRVEPVVDAAETDIDAEIDGQADTDAAVSESVGDETAKDKTATDAVETPVDPPSFDVVRLSNTGDSVFAGRAEPGSTVSILSNEEVIGTAKADDRGEWVFLPEKPLPPGSHELELQSQTEEDGVETESDQVVVLVVPEPGKDIAGQPAEEEQSVLAILVPKSGDGAIEVLQKPPAPDSVVQEPPVPDSVTQELSVPDSVAQKPSVPGSVESPDGDLSLESVDYDKSGNVSVAGKAKPGSTVRIYLDNEPVGDAEVSETGAWSATPEAEIEEGVYTLRADLVEEGAVTARIELPFSRAAPLVDFVGDSFIIVQPGNSLWRIARRTLGSGIKYTVIYNANVAQILDPDLIFPGQIFEVPSTN